MCDALYVGLEAWPSRTIFYITFKMVHSDGCFTYSLVNTEETNAKLQGSNM